MIDTAIDYVGAPGTNSAIASDSTNFLVVWLDEQNDNRLYAARVSSDGVVIDTNGIMISSSVDRLYEPAVAFDGDNYVVVWPGEGRGMCAARIAPSGVLIDSGGTVFYSGSYIGERPSVAFNGDNLLVAWQRYSTGGIYNYDIMAMRISPSCAALDSQPINVTRDTQPQTDPQVAASGSLYMVVWRDWRASVDDVRGCRITSSGVMLDSTEITVCHRNYDIWAPDISSADTSFFVVWKDTGIFGARVSRSGSILDPGGRRIDTEGDYYRGPVLDFDHGSYYVAWSGYNGLYGTLVAPDGQIRRPATRVDSFHDGHNLGGIAATRRNRMVVYDPALKIRVDSAGVALDSGASPFAYRANVQSSGVVAAGGSCLLVIWEDSRDGVSSMYATRLSRYGAVLDSAAWRICPSAVYPTSPTVAFDGTDFLVVWSEQRDGGTSVYGARVAESGVVLDTLGFRILPSGVTPAMSFDGANYLVVGADYPYVRAARVTPSGEVLDSLGFAVTSAGAYNPCVSFGDSAYLVAWERISYYGVWPNPYFTFRICVNQVSRDGQLLDSNDVAISTDVRSDWMQIVHPASAFDGSEYLVVWPYGGGIYGRRVSMSGQPADSAVRSIARGVSASVAREGSGYLLAGRTLSDISGWRLDGNANRIDSFGLVSQSGVQDQPTLIRDSTERYVLIYQGWAGVVGGRTFNSTRIWGKLGPFGEVAEGSSLTVEKPLSLDVAPNPVTSSVKSLVSYSVPTPGKVSLKLYDVAGKLVATLTQGYHPAGAYRYSLRPSQHSLAAGVYLLRFDVGRSQVTKKLVIE